LEFLGEQHRRLRKSQKPEKGKKHDGPEAGSLRRHERRATGCKDQKRTTKEQSPGELGIRWKKWSRVNRNGKTSKGGRESIVEREEDRKSYEG